MFVTLNILILILLVMSCDSARILGIFVTPSISHALVFRTITEELASRGHHLVILTSDPMKSNDPKYENVTEIDVHDESYDIFVNSINMASLRDASNTRAVFMPAFWNALHDILEVQVQHPIMKKILENPSEQFDLVLIEYLCASAFGFSHRFRAPMIAIGSLPGTIYNWEAAGNPTHPLLYADSLSTYVGKMNFLQRLETVFDDLIFRMGDGGMTEKFDQQSKRLFGKDTPHVTELERNVDLVIVNSFPILCGIRPLTPSTIMLGGMHINPQQPIPKDIEDYLDNSRNGVIYFSLGTNVKSNQLPIDRRQVLMDAFGELPYDVMWKYEDDILPGKPDNILISKWFPQFDMLSHPNFRVFIFQGGQQSMEEAVLSGVPMIAMPFIGDQDKNAKIIADKNMGLFFEIGKMTKESLKEAIFEVINNKMFKENVMSFSKIINDNPQSPREKAIWWIEYVLRHKGAKHLRSPMMDMPLYQYFMLDIFGFIIAGCVTVILILLYILKIIKSAFTKRKIKNH